MLGRARLRAVPLPRFRGSRRRHAIVIPGGSVPRRRSPPLPPDDLGSCPAAGPRAVRHREDRPGRVLPHLLGPDALREFGYALGFPRPLVDRVAKALETYDSVMVRRDLEAEGGFGQFFAHPGELGPQGPEAVAGAAAEAGGRGLVDEMGRLNHGRGGRERSPTDGSQNEAQADSRRSVKGGLISGDSPGSGAEHILVRTASGTNGVSGRDHLPITSLPRTGRQDPGSPGPVDRKSVV